MPSDDTRIENLYDHIGSLSAPAFIADENKILRVNEPLASLELVEPNTPLKAVGDGLRLRALIEKAAENALALSGQPLQLDNLMDVTVWAEGNGLFAGVFHEHIAANALNEGLYPHILDNIADACFVINADGCIGYMNSACSYFTTLTEDELLGAYFFGYHESLFWETVRTAQQQGQAKLVTFDGVILPKGITSRFAVRLIPSDNAVICIAQDVHGRQIMLSQMQDQRTLADALRKTAAVINNTLDLDEMIDTIFEQIERVIEFDMASLMILEEDGAHVVRSVGYDSPEEQAYIRDLVIALEDAPNLRQMIADKQPMVVPDVVRETQWNILNPAIRSYVGAPIINNDEVLGFLNLDARTPQALDTTDATRLAMFADQVSVAIQNAALYEQVQLQVHELENRNADLKVFAHAAAHDLRAPLQVILGMSDLLTAFDDSSGLDENARIGLKTIAEYAVRMEEIIKNLLSLAQLRNQTIELETIDVEALFDQVLADYDMLISGRGVEIDIATPLPTAIAHGQLLVQVLSNYVENAIKYIGSKNKSPRIHIYAETEGDRVRYVIADNGVGVPEDKREAVFEAFTRTHPNENQGHGLGLSIVKRIAEGMGGQVGVMPSEMGGSAFWVELNRPSES